MTADDGSKLVSLDRLRAAAATGRAPLAAAALAKHEAATAEMAELAAEEVFSPSVERAAELLIHEAETTGLIRDDVRNALAAALDVEEMARILGRHDEIEWGTREHTDRCKCGQDLNTGGPSIDAAYLALNEHVAHVLRGRILGEDPS